MTTAELNRDIKRLAKKSNEYAKQGGFDDKTENEIHTEIKRLYNADNKFEYMNKASVLILLRLNLKYRPIQLYTFGQHIEL